MHVYDIIYAEYAGPLLRMCNCGGGGGGSIYIYIYGLTNKYTL